MPVAMFSLSGKNLVHGNACNLEIENAALKAHLFAQAAQLDKITAALQGAGIAVEK